jgi:hypothetical protein
LPLEIREDFLSEVSRYAHLKDAEQSHAAIGSEFGFGCMTFHNQTKNIFS